MPPGVEHYTLLLALLLMIALPAIWLVLRRRQEHHLSEDLSPITRQHIDLFQGGQLSEGAVESFKVRYREMLEKGEVAAVEASLRGGIHYVVQVRALTELGTDAAGHFVERQLQRKLSDDQIEQAWYWIDLAHGLRALNRLESLPHLLRCADRAGELPLGQFFAAETICFLGFAGYLRQPDTPLGRSALRLLHRALEGLRFGLPPFIVAEARVGELVEAVWDTRCEEQLDPLAVRVFVEGVRLWRRGAHAEALLEGDPADLEGFRWQMSRLSSLEPILTEYLSEAPGLVFRQLRSAPVETHRELLLALNDLRGEAGTLLLELLGRPDYPQRELAVDALRWSADPRVGSYLREWALAHVQLYRRAQRRPRATSARWPSIPRDFPYRALLRTLRAHPSPQTEAFLLLAARDYDPLYRTAAVSSLGWWEPLDRPSVLRVLQDARRDITPEGRQTARGALARLGERRALQWFRQTLTSEDPTQVHEAIQTVAQEALTLLYVDLDHLADADDPDVAHHAREALERMCEDMEHQRH
jgi:hypothetical protein